MVGDGAVSADVLSARPCGPHAVPPVLSARAEVHRGAASPRTAWRRPLRASGGEPASTGFHVARVVLTARARAEVNHRRALPSRRRHRPLRASGGEPVPPVVAPTWWRPLRASGGEPLITTALVEERRERVSTLERLLRLAMRIIRRANRRLRAAGCRPRRCRPSSSGTRANDAAPLSGHVAGQRRFRHVPIPFSA